MEWKKKYLGSTAIINIAILLLAYCFLKSIMKQWIPDKFLLRLPADTKFSGMTKSAERTDTWVGPYPLNAASLSSTGGWVINILLAFLPLKGLAM